MKNNSFKFNGPFPKKLVLTALLATVLSGPYVYQISSKDFSTSEFASTASELSEADKLEIAYKVDAKLALAKLNAIPKYKDLTELPPSSGITDDEALKAIVAAVEVKKATLEVKKAEAEKEKLIDAAKKAKLEEIEKTEKAEKKKKADAEEAKRNDCNDKDKTASEKRECREDAKKEEKEKKTEEASKKFDDKLETAWNFCESRSERTKDSSTRSSDTAADVELACKSKAFVKALSTRDKNLTATAVNAQFRELLGNDLFAMLYSTDENDAERASIILSNIFNGKVPAQFAGLKQMIMDEVRRKADAPAKKVAAEFKKANTLPQGTERTNQFNAALTAKGELDARVDAYKASMLYPAEKAGDRDALAYYHSSFTKGIDALMLKVMTGSTTIGGEVGGANRGGATRGGTSTEAAVIRGADGKMTQSGGVEYSLLRPGTIEHINFGTPRTTRRATENGTTESEKLRLGTRVSK